MKQLGSWALASLLTIGATAACTSDDDGGDNGAGDGSGGASTGAGDLAQAVETAIINKRAGGMGLISGRKAFQRPMGEGIELLNAIQDVYRCKDVTIA